MKEHIPITVTEKMTDMKKITGGTDLTKKTDEAVSTDMTKRMCETALTDKTEMITDIAFLTKIITQINTEMRIKKRNQPSQSVNPGTYSCKNN